MKAYPALLLLALSALFSACGAVTGTVDDKKGETTASITFAPSGKTLTKGTVGKSYTAAISAQATGGGSVYLWLEEDTSELPSGLEFVRNDQGDGGDLTGTPTVEGGPFSLTFMATDDFGNLVQKTYVLSIQPYVPPPTELTIEFESGSFSDIMALEEIDVGLKVKNPKASATYTWVVSGAPAWIDTASFGSACAVGGMVPVPANLAGKQVSFEISVSDDSVPVKSGKLEVDFDILPRLEVATNVTGGAPYTSLVSVIGFVDTAGPLAISSFATGTQPPTWLSFNSATSRFSSSTPPLVSTPETFALSMEAVDLTTAQTYIIGGTLIVNPPISILTTTLEVTEGSDLSEALNYSGGSLLTGGGAIWGWASLPDPELGLGLHFAGILSGFVPYGTVGNYTLSVTASDINGVTASQDIALTVKEAPLTINDTGIPNAYVGKDYIFQPVGGGGSAPTTHVWSIESGPNFLEINATTGKISTTRAIEVADIDTVELKLVLDDSTSATPARRTFSLSVTSEPLKFRYVRSFDPDIDINGVLDTRYDVDLCRLSDAYVGVPYAATTDVVGGLGAIEWALDAGTPLPDGLVLDPATGAITGTPTTAGEVTFTVVAQDASPEIRLPHVITVRDLASGEAMIMAGGRHQYWNDAAYWLFAPFDDSADGVIGNQVGTRPLGNGGAALNAIFAFPAALRFDREGNLLMASAEFASIRRIRADPLTGLVGPTSVVEDLLNEDDGINYGGDANGYGLNGMGVGGLDVDDDGNVYFLIAMTSQVYKWDAATRQVTRVGPPLGDLATFFGMCLAVTPDGSAVYAGGLAGPPNIKRIEVATGAVSSIGPFGPTEVNLINDDPSTPIVSVEHPDFSGMIVDASGNLYVAKSNAQFGGSSPAGIYRVTPGGSITQVVGDGVPAGFSIGTFIFGPCFDATGKAVFSMLVPDRSGGMSNFIPTVIYTLDPLTGDVSELYETDLLGELYPAVDSAGKLFYCSSGAMADAGASMGAIFTLR